MAANITRQRVNVPIGIDIKRENGWYMARAIKNRLCFGRSRTVKSALREFILLVKMCVEVKDQL